MKAVILAGGFGTRISEESYLKPKPLIEIGGKPILWHILKIYSSYDINEFIICLGYKGYMIKEYFSNYFLHTSDITFDISKNKITVHQKYSEPWIITLVDTGEGSLTGGRLKRVKKYLKNETFCFTYGDGVADVDIKKLLNFHRSHNKIATLTGVKPPGRYGALKLNETSVDSFQEKPDGDGSWINGGFFVLDSEIFNYIDNDKTSWEGDSLITLSKIKQLECYKHDGFWSAMDTLRDKNNLDDLWNSKNPPWKIWD